MQVPGHTLSLVLQRQLFYLLMSQLQPFKSQLRFCLFIEHAGGITECKKILSMAEAFDVAAAPHCPLGPIALAACLQVDATCHNAFI